MQSTSDSCGQGRIFPGGASPATCTLSPLQLAEGWLAQDGAVSYRTRCAPPPVGDRSELEGQEWALLGGDSDIYIFLHIYNLKHKKNSWFDSARISTFVALSAKIELGELDVGPKLFGVSLLDVLKPRQCRPLWVRHIQVVHG